MSALTFDQAVLTLLRPLPKLGSQPRNPPIDRSVEGLSSIKTVYYPAEVDQVGAVDFRMKISFSFGGPYISIERETQIASVDNVQYMIDDEIFKLHIKEGKIATSELIEEKDLPDFISVKKVPPKSDVLQKLEDDRRMLSYQSRSVVADLLRFCNNDLSEYLDPEAPKHMQEDLAKFKALQSVLELCQRSLRRDYVFKVMAPSGVYEWFNVINDRAVRLRDLAKSLEIILTHQRGMAGEKGLDDVIDTAALNLSQQRLFDLLHEVWKDYFHSQVGLYEWVIESLKKVPQY